MRSSSGSTQRGIEPMTVGRAGETIQLVEQSPTALGQNLVIRAR